MRRVSAVVRELISPGFFKHLKFKNMATWIFFEEGNEDEILFECEADDHEEAFDVAFESMGPQVNDWMYKLKLNQ